MDVLRTKVEWQFALTYLQQILVLLQMPYEHIEHGGQVLTLLNDASLTLNLKKFEFFTSCINYLIHVTGLGTTKCHMLDRHSLTN